MYYRLKTGRAAIYLEMAKKMSDAAEHAADEQVAATYLELAGKWTRLAESAGEHGDNDDLPEREDFDEQRSEMETSTERHA